MYIQPHGLFRTSIKTVGSFLSFDMDLRWSQTCATQRTEVTSVSPSCSGVRCGTTQLDSVQDFIGSKLSVCLEMKETKKEGEELSNMRIQMTAPSRNSFPEK